MKIDTDEFKLYTLTKNEVMLLNKAMAVIVREHHKLQKGGRGDYIWELQKAYALSEGYVLTESSIIQVRP